MHCIHKDFVGLGTLVLVYATMIVGNLLYLYSGSYSTFVGHIPLGAGAIIELIVFETLWGFMLWCHSYTMLTEPGYVPKDYKYNIETLPKQYRSLLGQPDAEQGQEIHVENQAIQI